MYRGSMIAAVTVTFAIYLQLAVIVGAARTAGPPPSPAGDQYSTPQQRLPMRHADANGDAEHELGKQAALSRQRRRLKFFGLFDPPSPPYRSPSPPYRSSSSSSSQCGQNTGETCSWTRCSVGWCDTTWLNECRYPSCSPSPPYRSPSPPYRAPPPPSKKRDGSACSSSSQCTNGSCRGGNCCNNAKGKGSGCNDCDSDGDCRRCDSGYYLSSYKCYSAKSDGTSCSFSSHCRSGSCRGGNCCGSKGRSSGCNDCNSGGTCSRCDSGYFLSSSSCSAKKSDGSTCSSSSQCKSGSCRGGNCCGSKGRGGGCNDCNSAGDCSRCDAPYFLLSDSCYLTTTTVTATTTTITTVSTTTATTSTTTTTCGVGYGFSAGTNTLSDTCARCPADAYQTTPNHRAACKPCACPTNEYDSDEGCGTRDLTNKLTFAITAGTGCKLSDSDTCVSSNNHPNNYGDREWCAIAAAKGSKLRVVAFNTESGYDYLTVNGKRYSGSGLSVQVLTSDSISWKTDGGVTRSGWKICLEKAAEKWISVASKCTQCDNIECAGTEYREGTCSGRTNGYVCKSTTTTSQTTTTTTTRTTTTATTTTSATATTTSVSSTTTTTSVTTTSTVTTTTVTTITTVTTTTITGTSTTKTTTTVTYSSTTASSTTTTVSSTTTSMTSTTTSASSTTTTLSSTTSTTTTVTTVTVTTTTTTTQVCNGRPDDTDCGSDDAVCNPALSGANFRPRCPVLCGTCISTATSSATSTQTTTAVSTATTSPSTTPTSTASVTVDTTATTTATSTVTSTVTTGVWNEVNDFVESGALADMVAAATAKQAQSRLAEREARSAAASAVEATYRSSEDAFISLGGTFDLKESTQCPPGHFLQFSGASPTGACRMCFPGTFSRPAEPSQEAVPELHRCSGQCQEKYTSKYGARSDADCTPMYHVMDTSLTSQDGIARQQRRARRGSTATALRQHRAPNSTHAYDETQSPGYSAAANTPLKWRTCEGAEDTTGNLWRNRGYAYITSRDECEEAGQALHSHDVDVYSATMTQVQDPCSDVNTLTGTEDFNASFICKKIKETQGGACSSSSTLYRNSNGVQPIAVDCSSTCSSCGTDPRFCGTDPNANAVRKPSFAAPVGFCVLEMIKAGSLYKQRLSFYDECSAGFYDGSEFSPICKIVECAENQQIKDNGAVAVGPGVRPLETDNPVCESNEVLRQYLEEQAKERYKLVYWAMLTMTAACLFALACVWSNRTRDGAKIGDAVESSAPRAAATRPFCPYYWREVKVTMYLAFKLADVTSDWGFWAIEVNNNFLLKEVLVKQNMEAASSDFQFALNYDQFMWLSLALGVLGTLTLPGDIYALYLRHTFKLKMDDYVEATEKRKMEVRQANQAEGKTPFLPNIYRGDDKPRDSSAEVELVEPEAPSAAQYWPFLTMLFEDIPQIVLAVYFLQVMSSSEYRDENSSRFLTAITTSDPLAVFSLVLSSIGLLVNAKYAFKIPDLFSCWKVVKRCWSRSVQYKPYYFHADLSRKEVEDRLSVAHHNSDLDSSVPVLIWEDSSSGRHVLSAGLFDGMTQTSSKSYEYHHMHIVENKDGIARAVEYNGETLDLKVKGKRGWVASINMLLEEMQLEYGGAINLVPHPEIVVASKVDKTSDYTAVTGTLCRNVKGAITPMTTVSRAQQMFAEAQLNAESSDDSDRVVITLGGGGLSGESQTDGMFDAGRFTLSRKTGKGRSKVNETVSAAGTPALSSRKMQNVVNKFTLRRRPKNAEAKHKKLVIATPSAVEAVFGTKPGASANTNAGSAFPQTTEHWNHVTKRMVGPDIDLGALAKRVDIYIHSLKNQESTTFKSVKSSLLAYCRQRQLHRAEAGKMFERSRRGLSRLKTQLATCIASDVPSTSSMVKDFKGEFAKLEGTLFGTTPSVMAAAHSYRPADTAGDVEYNEVINTITAAGGDLEHNQVIQTIVAAAAANASAARLVTPPRDTEDAIDNDAERGTVVMGTPRAHDAFAFADPAADVFAKDVRWSPEERGAAKIIQTAFRSYLRDKHVAQKIMSGYSHKMIPVVNEAQRTSKQQWSAAKRKWMVLDIPADCYEELERDGRFDTASWV